MLLRTVRGGSIRLPLLACFAALLVLQGGVLPPSQAQEPPRDVPPGELEAATRTAEALLEAWRDDDEEALHELSRESWRQQALTGSQALLWAHMSIHELGEPRPTVLLGRRRLEIQFAWRAELDVQGVVDAVMERLRSQAEARDALEPFEEAAQARRQQIRSWASLQAERIGLSPQRLRLSREPEGWRLAEWLSVELGASEPDVGAELFLAAFASRDPVQARGAMSAEFRRAFEDRIGEHLLLGSVVRDYEQTRLDRLGEERARVEVRWQVDFRPEWIERHLMEEYRWELEFGERELGESDLEAELNRRRDELERRTTAFAARVETFGAQLTLKRKYGEWRGGRWFVNEITPVEQEAQGGAPSPEEALRAGLQALRAHDFDAIENVSDPARSDGFARGAEGRRAARALTLESFELGEVIRREAMPRRARVEYTWEASLDAEALKEAMREEYRAHMRERGHDDGAIEELLRDREPALAEYVGALQEELEAKEQAAELRRIGERWYLIELVAG